MTWKDRLSSDEVVKRLCLKEFKWKMKYRRFQWFGNVKRDAEGGVLRVLDDMEVAGKRKAGRPKKTRGDTVSEEDKEILGVDEKMTIRHRY